MHWNDLLIPIIGTASEFLGTLSGFGSSTFFIPMGVYIEKFNFILVLTALLHVFGNIIKLFLFREHLKIDLIIKYALPSIVLAGLGAIMNQFIAFDRLKIILGIFIMLIALVFLFKQKIIKNLNSQTTSLTIGLSGFLTGLLGTGGALRGIALSSLHIEKSSFVVLSSAIDLGGDILRAGIYTYNGYFDWTHWYYIPLLLVAAYLGSTFGKNVLNRINQKQFEKIVLVFVFISGLMLILE